MKKIRWKVGEHRHTGNLMVSVIVGTRKLVYKQRNLCSSSPW